MKLEEIESRINDLTERMADAASLSKGVYDELGGELLVYKTAFDLLKKNSRIYPCLALIDCIERCARHLFDGRFGLALTYYQMSPKTFKDGIDRRHGDVSTEFITSVCRTCRHIEAVYEAAMKPDIRPGEKIIVTKPVSIEVRQWEKKEVES